MFSRRSIWLVAVLAAVIAAGAFLGLQHYRYRFVQSNSGVLRLLPRTDATTFFVDVEALRQSGYLKLLAAQQRQQEKDYSEFVRNTGFDYAKDLDALAGTVDERELFFVVRGHFHWPDIHKYFTSHKGSCEGDTCTMTASTPGKKVSIRSMQPDVAALLVSANGQDLLRSTSFSERSAAPSDAPVWIRPSNVLLQSPAQLPAALRMFAIPLAPADSVMLTLRPAEDSASAFRIGIDAVFPNTPIAETARSQLTLDTSRLKLELAREHRKADPADLAWLLTSGSFQNAGQHLTGTWTVRKELLGSLE